MRRAPDARRRRRVLFPNRSPARSQKTQRVRPAVSMTFLPRDRDHKTVRFTFGSERRRLHFIWEHTLRLINHSIIPITVFNGEPDCPRDIRWCCPKTHTPCLLIGDRRRRERGRCARGLTFQRRR